MIFVCLLAVSFWLSTVANGQEANLVLLTDAVQLGAVCLDGSAPGYYFKPGQRNS